MSKYCSKNFFTDHTYNACNGTFHEQHSIGYGFPSLLLARRASADVSELVFKHKWRSKKLNLFLADFRGLNHCTAAPCYTALLWSSSSAFTVYVVVPSSSTSKVVPIIPRQSTSNCHRLNISGGIITSCVIFYFQCCLTHLRISEKIVKRDRRNSNRLAKWYTAYHREIIR